MSREIPESAPHPFFLERPDRRLFAIHYPPSGEVADGAGVVFLPPFAEEMNRSRRMASLLARAVSASGGDALIFDLSGTGDSVGEFSTARWDAWQDDADAAIEWLAGHTGRPVTLVGLRLGAFLALHTAQTKSEVIDRIVLWQPVTSGRNMLTQFLRVRVAAAMTRGGEGETTESLWSRLADGQSVDVAGYEISADLAQAIAALSLVDSPPLAKPVHWLDVAAEEGRELTPGSRRIVEQWREAGVSIAADTVAGEPFWTIQETTVAPALIDRTVEMLGRGAT